MTLHEILINWAILAGVNFAATISPGPAFAMTVRNSMAYGRRAAIISAIGLGLACGVLVMLVAVGFAAVLSQSAMIFTLLKYAGGSYLAYIGIKALMVKKAPHLDDDTIEVPAYKIISDLQAFRLGFLTNLFNPKGLVFFAAVYAQFINPHTPWQVFILYGMTTVAIEAGWFSFVSVVLTDRRIKAKFMRVSHWIERVCGGLLIMLGLRLALK